MDINSYEIYFDVEKAIDLAFEGKYVLKFYDYLKVKNIKKDIVEQFIDSTIVTELNELIDDLNEYLKGGSDDEHKQLREAYGFVSKPEARKIKDYLLSILQDAEKYNYDKRRGKRKKPTK
jgi:hypothetical protein